MITCIIPHYNHNDLIERAIRSAIGEVDEIIVVDDGSDIPIDATVAKFPGVKLIKHDKNYGLGATRNTGIFAARGEWIIPLDADDELCTGSAHTMLQNAKDSDIVFGNIIYHGEKMYPNRETNYDALLTSNRLNATSLFKKSIWEYVGGYCEERPFYEDWDFWGRCAKAGAIMRYVDVDVYKYHGGRMCKEIEPIAERITRKVIQHIKDYVPPKVPLH